MEASYQAIRLPAFAVNRTRRLIKAPKLYWSDTALALYLAGESRAARRAPRESRAHGPAGLARRAAATPGGAVLAHRHRPRGRLRDRDAATGPAHRGQGVRAGRAADAKGLEAFLDEYPDQTDGALLLHGGTETFPLTRRVLAAPWWRVC